MAAALATGALACGFSAPVEASTRVTLATLPRDTTVAELAQVPGLALGVMSAGIGDVPSEQTFLDISQGNRIDDVLYHRPLPGLFPFAREVPGWREVIARASDAPAGLTPGLLAQRLRSAGIPALAAQPMNAAAVLAADRRGVVAPLRPAEFRDARSGLAVIAADSGDLLGLVRQLSGDDLLIATASPPPDSNRALPIGIAGRGFGGTLTSASTRTEGYVLSTDLAPTVLRRFGLSIPDDMDGDPIRAEGTVDAEAVEELADRMAVIPPRRAPLVIVCLAAWIVGAAGVALLGPAARRAAAAWIALAFAYLPLMLLAGAAIQPAALAEGLLVGVGCGGLAALTLGVLGDWRALAIACAFTLLAYAIDVIAGSGLTSLSLLGPNPIFGVRFYGIGNELEALFAVMIPAGVAAGLSGYTARGREVTRGRAVGAFLLAGAVGAIVFGVGRFGADVGAAIVLPVGAVVAVAALPTAGSPAFARYGAQKSANPTRSGRRFRIAAAVIGAPFIALVLLAVIDLASSGNAHLTHSVIDAGGAGSLADVAERRLRLSAHDFGKAAGNPLFWIVIVGIGLVLSQGRRIDAWLEPSPIARAGLIGACAAVAVGVLVNDSGATFLTLGALALGAFLAFAWSRTGQIQ